MLSLSKPRIRRCLGAMLLALLPSLLLTACATDPSRFYVLSSGAEEIQGAESAAFLVGLHPVDLPSEVDRSQMVFTVAPHQRQIAEFDRWAGSLKEHVTRVVRDGLEAHLGANSVFTLPRRSSPPLDYNLRIEVMDIDAILEDRCALRAQFHISDASGIWLASHSFRTVSESPSESADGIAAALSDNLQTLNEFIAMTLGELRSAGTP